MFAALRQYLINRKLRVKLLAAFGSLLLLSVFLIARTNDAVSRIISLKDTNEQVDELKLHVESLAGQSAEFMYEGYKATVFLEKQQSPVADSFASAYSHANALLLALQNQHPLPVMDSVKQSLDSLNRMFTQLMALLHTRGFKDNGLEGALRQSIHNVENSGIAFDKAEMLMLRRHEKDFFLRKDLKYQHEFNTRLQAFRESVAVGSPELVPFLDNYQRTFNQVVSIEQTIGLTASSGIRGAIHTTLQHVRPQIERLRTSIKDTNDHQVAITRLWLWIIFAVQLIAGVALAIVYADWLIKPIKEIRRSVQKLAAGTFPEPLPVISEEEIGQTRLALNQFVDRLHAATAFAGSLGSGSATHEHLGEDVLAQSLVSAHQQLRQAAEQQHVINWMNEGAARFNELMKADAHELSVLGDNIIRLVVTYLQANQGALYQLNGNSETGTLERLATYAWGKKRYHDHTIAAGEGLPGQCVQEGQTIYLREIPAGYVKITSGLGEATPRVLVLVPLRTRDQVAGVLELASFNEMEPYQIEFLERMAETMASMLVSRNQAAATAQLLEESRRRAETLAQQEESMRQYAEELQATQEDWERQRTALQQELAALRHRYERQEVIPS